MLLSLAIQTPEVPLPVPVTLLSGKLEEKLAKAAAMGYDGVELVTTDPASLDTNALRTSLRMNRLRVSAIASGGMAFAAKLTLLHTDPAMAAVARRRLEQMIDLAAALGAPVVTIGSFRGRSINGMERSKQGLADVLRQAGKRAADCGVRLALEPLNRYEADLFHTAADVLEFIRDANAPALGLLLDTYHMNTEECSWTEPFRQVMAAGKLFYVHLGDNNRLPPGQGFIDFRLILRTLREIAYDGWLSAELFPRPDGDAAAQQTAQTMRKWMSELS